MNDYRYHLAPAFSDNYIFVIENIKTHKCVVVDPGSAVEVVKLMEEKSLETEALLITHHHWDHIDGIAELVAYAKAKGASLEIYAPEKSRNEIPQASHYVKESDRVSAIGLDFQVLDLPGHTLDHIGYYEKSQGWLFSGDVLFGLGCGRLFEGTVEQQFNSLSKIKKLNSETKVFCTHEYTERNLEFCKQVLLPTYNVLDPASVREYEKQLVVLRNAKQPSVPLSLSEELKCNPFLIARGVEEFTEIRKLRNGF